MDLATAASPPGSHQSFGSVVVYTEEFAELLKNDVSQSHAHTLIRLSLVPLLLVLGVFRLADTICTAGIREIAGARIQYPPSGS